MGATGMDRAQSTNRDRWRPALDGPERRWHPPARPVIAALVALEALLAGGFALWPPADSNRLLDAVLAVVLAVAAVAMVATWRVRGPLWLVVACLMLSWLAPLAVISTRQLESSQVLWAATLILAAVLAAFYLPLRIARWQVGGIVVGYVIASLAFGQNTRPLFVIAMGATIVACAYAVALMRKDRDRVLLAIATMATTDPLTGLLNRRGLEAEATVVRANSLRAGRSTVVALIDIDGLKAVNDTVGHDAGDDLITSVAQHWRTHLREGDLVARVGGDEFVIVLAQVDETAASDLLQRVRSTTSGPWSHGWTTWGPDEPLDAAIARADARMYVEKAERHAGRDGSPA